VNPLAVAAVPALLAIVADDPEQRALRIIELP
jgi:hypothetical protein